MSEKVEVCCDGEEGKTVGMPDLTTSLIDSVDIAAVDVGPVDRYYKKLYSSKEHLCYMFHTNRVCIVTLAPLHPIIVEGKSVEKVCIFTILSSILHLPVH